MNGSELQALLDASLEVNLEGQTVTLGAFPVELRSGQCLYNGRIEGAGGVLLHAKNVDTIDLHDLEIVTQHPGNYPTGVWLENCDSANIEHVTFIVEPSPRQLGETMMSLLISNCSNVYAHSCESYGGQFKIGHGGGRNIRIENNDFYSCDAFAVSAVLMVDALLEDVHIHSNNVYGVRNGAVYIGNDGGDFAPTVGTVRNVSVTDNSVYGPFDAPNGTCIFFRPGLVNEDITITGNELLCWGEGLQNVPGIYIKEADDGLARGERVRIEDNLVANFSHAGIAVRAALDAVVIQDNRVSNCRWGTRVQYHDCSRPVVVGNETVDCGDGNVLEAL